MADNNNVTPASPRNFGGQFLDFIREAAKQLKARYTKEEADAKFLSQTDASENYETKADSKAKTDAIQSQIEYINVSKADREYVDNTFISKEGENSTAASADKLVKAVMINGTPFDGTEDIYTEAWGEPRQIVLSDSAERNKTVVTDFDGTRNLKLIMPSSACFKDILADGTITCNELVITGYTEDDEGNKVPAPAIFNIVNATDVNATVINTSNLTVTGDADLAHIACVDLTASSFIKGDTVHSTHNYSTSDERLKSDIKKLKLYETYSFGPCSYKFKDEKKTSVGLIAQDVLKEFPEAIYKGKDGYLAIDYSAVVALLCGRINRLEKRIR